MLDFELRTTVRSALLSSSEGGRSTAGSDDFRPSSFAWPTVEGFVRSFANKTVPEEATNIAARTKERIAFSPLNGRVEPYQLQMGGFCAGSRAFVVLQFALCWCTQ